MSEEELSELTSEEDELAWDDSQKTNHGSRAPRAGGGSEGYKLQKALKPPRATTYTAQALYDQIHNGDIDLDPEYQRDVVWTKEKQTGIIDSILRNFYIPPIIFAVNTYDDGSESKTCIDGKQRLTSIHRFMDGLIPHRDPITNEKLWFKNDSGPNSTSKSAKAKKLLPEKYRTMFANKQIVCVEYADLTDSDERDIFQRVQLGMALTSAEKLHVINTPRAQFVRAILASHVTDDTLASSKLPWDTARGSDFRCIAQAIFCMDKWHTSKTSLMKNAGTLPQVEKWLVVGADGKKGGKGVQDDEYSTIGVEVPESFAKRVRETYDIFVKLATASKYSEPFTVYPKVSPIEMICIALLIYVHGVLPPQSSRLTLSELRDTILEMREDVRNTHKDIRMNDRVGKTMVEFIKTVSKDSSSKKSKKHEHEAASTTSSARAKRKRYSAAMDDDDDDYRESSRSSAKKTSASQSASPARRKSKLQEAVPSGSGPSKYLPTPTSSSASAPPHRRVDALASVRAARAATASARREEATPNPQRLPSPGAAPSFSFSGGLLNGAGARSDLKGDDVSMSGQHMMEMWNRMMGNAAMPPLTNGMQQMQLGMSMPGMMNGPPPGPSFGPNNS